MYYNSAENQELNAESGEIMRLAKRVYPQVGNVYAEITEKIKNKFKIKSFTHNCCDGFLNVEFLSGAPEVNLKDVNESFAWAYYIGASLALKTAMDYAEYLSEVKPKVKRKR